eukprot:950232-Pelagomonas_calceolata.AAC.3
MNPGWTTIIASGNTITALLHFFLLNLLTFLPRTLKPPPLVSAVAEPLELSVGTRYTTWSPAVKDAQTSTHPAKNEAHAVMQSRNKRDIHFHMPLNKLKLSSGPMNKEPHTFMQPCDDRGIHSTTINC